MCGHSFSINRSLVSVFSAVRSHKELIFPNANQFENYCVELSEQKNPFCFFFCFVLFVFFSFFLCTIFPTPHLFHHTHPRTTLSMPPMFQTAQGHLIGCLALLSLSGIRIVLHLSTCASTYEDACALLLQIWTHIMVQCSWARVTPTCAYWVSG